MTPTITISVSIQPVSSKDWGGGTVNVRIPRRDDDGTIRTVDDLAAAAMEKACKRLHGRNAYWVSENGSPGYGQVMTPLGGGPVVVTARSSLSVQIPDLGDEHRAAIMQREKDDA